MNELCARQSKLKVEIDKCEHWKHVMTRKTRPEKLGILHLSNSWTSNSRLLGDLRKEMKELDFRHNALDEDLKHLAKALSPGRHPPGLACAPCRSWWEFSSSERSSPSDFLRLWALRCLARHGAGRRQTAVLLPDVGRQRLQLAVDTGAPGGDCRRCTSHLAKMAQLRDYSLLNKRDRLL